MKRKQIAKRTLIATEYSIYRGQLKDFVLDHWYNDWLFRVSIEVYIDEYTDGSKEKRRYLSNVEYAYRLNNFSGCSRPECWAWCVTKTVASNIQYRIDYDFLICSKLIRHISEEEENKLLLYHQKQERINYETI